MKPFKTNLPRQRGLSIVEVMLALAISGVIAVALSSIFARSVQSRTQIERDGQKIEAGRYVLDVIGEDIRLAGFYGDYMPQGSTGSSNWPDLDTKSPPAFVWRYPDPCAGAASNGALIGTSYADRVGWYNGDSTNAGAPTTLPSARGQVPNWDDTQIWAPVAVFGYRSPGAGALPCLDNRLIGATAGEIPDVLTIRRASGVSYRFTGGAWVAVNGGTDAGVTAGDLYLQPSTCDSDARKFDLRPMSGALDNSGFNLLRTLACNAAVVAPIRRFVQRTYYVSSCNRCTPSSDGIPTLKVAEIVGGRMVSRPVAPGVENLFFEYGVDGNADGSADGYQLSVANPTVVPNPASLGDEPPVPPAVGSAPAFRWQNVMSVKTFVLVRDLQATNQYNNTNVYSMGTSAAPADRRDITAADSFRRAVFSSTTRLANPSGAREAP